MRPQILCISFSNIQSDARVLRQLEVLAGLGDVTTLSFGSKPSDSTLHLEIDESLPSLPQTVTGVAKLALRLFKSVELEAPAVKAALHLVGGKSFDLVVANEARALPLAHKLSRGAPIWGDLHEWAPEERTHVLSWRLLIKPYMTWLCKKYLPLTHGITAVNESIAKLYRERFNCTVEVVRNSRSYVPLTPSPIIPGVIRLAHSGAAVPGRNLEGMIEAVKDLGAGYTLDLYLVQARDNGRYWRELKDLASHTVNIRFHDAVPPDELPLVLNQYDIGIFSLPPKTTNHQLMLPNKFFDFVQARLAIVFSPSPETNRLIEEFHLGQITEDFSSSALAATIRSMSSTQIVQCKQNSHSAAHSLSSEDDETVQRHLIQKLVKLSPRLQQFRRNTRPS